MFKTRKVDEFGGQTGNDEQSEDVVITEEKIVGDDGVERTIIKKTTTRRSVQTQNVTQGARVTTVKRTVTDSNGRQITHEFKSDDFKGLDDFKHLGIDNKEALPIENRKSRSGSTSSSSSSDDGIKDRIKSFFGGKSKDKSKEKKDEKHSAIKDKSEPSSPTHTSHDTPSSHPTDDDKEFAEECLKWHNYYREKHGVKPLKLSHKLCEYAEEWAKEIAKKDSLEHRPHNTYGENIFMKWSSNPHFKIAGRDPVDNWYAEIKDHTFGREPTSLASGHFTQVVWKESEELGVAKARTKTGKIVVVANYNPAGNMLGDFATNVLPAKH
ncbi:unnamed protein product [Medioppia subpectinata]|uniref:SCP domain-containing protein n=1 Tax=Medioppia subpectinata TaxID=1979941 RepID=A0A7R9Q5N6_9ACAR|nr:unnamed protein product [Medioppia subpectinata]CAG2113938.1 unnamed protein product [Medioppia subpectinata]